jgi:hypothetical protein
MNWNIVAVITALSLSSQAFAEESKVDKMTVGDIKGKIKEAGKKDKKGPKSDPKADLQARHKPCHDDFAKLCKDAKTGHDEMLQCLSLNKDKLSEECKKVLPEIESMHGKK